MESSPTLRDLVPFVAMQGAQQTSLSPVRWAGELWYGPEHGRGLWAHVRDAVVAVGRPIAKRLRLDGLVEFVRLGLAIERMDTLIRPLVRSSYHRDDLDAVASDVEIEQAHLALLAQAVRVLKTLPTGGHRSPPPAAGARRSHENRTFRRDVMRDDTVSQRVAHASRLLEEMSASLDKLGLPADVTDLGDKPPTDPCHWAYDPSVPTVVARRLMAGRRVVFAPHLVRVARGTWSVQAQRQAALDWADDVDDFVGYLGAAFGVEVPSLPSSARLDLAAVMADHAAVQSGREKHLNAAIEAVRAD